MTDAFFSDVFKVAPEAFNATGAFDISLVCDLPLFIDPFLLFNSEKPEYQELHANLLKYMIFLRDQAVSGELDKALIWHYYSFPEIRHTWFGYSQMGNRGRGLGRQFAEGLHDSFQTVFRNFGTETITRSSHIEKLCLLKPKIGKDFISDFTTNLIVGYLAEYTQAIAKSLLPPHMQRVVRLHRARFNFKTATWESEQYSLPYRGDHILLAPKELLTKDSTWIDRSDLLYRFSDIAQSLPNDELRSKVNAYYRARIPPVKPTAKHYLQAKEATLDEFPEIVDYYIREREQAGEFAGEEASRRVAFAQRNYVDAARQLLRQDSSTSGLSALPANTHAEARARLLFLKDRIEKGGLHKIFDHPDRHKWTEQDLQLLFTLVWCGSGANLSAEVNDGRGPVDFMVSRGAYDKILVEFKLASNSKLERNLRKQLSVYEGASRPTHPSLTAIFYFNDKEFERVQAILTRLKLLASESIILIDASPEKPSGSKA